MRTAEVTWVGWFITYALGWNAWMRCGPRKLRGSVGSSRMHLDGMHGCDADRGSYVGRLVHHVCTWMECMDAMWTAEVTWVGWFITYALGWNAWMRCGPRKVRDAAPGRCGLSVPYGSGSD